MNDTQQILEAIQNVEKKTTEAIQNVEKKTAEAIQGVEKRLTKRLDDQGKKLDNLTSEVSHIKTAIKPLATKEDVEAEVDNSKTEILAAILALNAKVTTKIHKHDKSINALHEGTEVPDPNTH